MPEDHKVEQVLLQTRVDPAVARWADDLADEFRMSRSAFLAFVIEHACKSPGWLIEQYQRHGESRIEAVAKKHQTPSKPKKRRGGKEG